MRKFGEQVSLVHAAVHQIVNFLVVLADFVQTEFVLDAGILFGIRLGVDSPILRTRFVDPFHHLESVVESDLTAINKVIIAHSRQPLSIFDAADRFGCRRECERRYDVGGHLCDLPSEEWRHVLADVQRHWQDHDVGQADRVVIVSVAEVD